MATVTVLLLPRETRKSAIATELARLADFERVASLRAEGNYAALLTGRVATDGRVPEGICPSGATFVVEGRAAA